MGTAHPITVAVWNTWHVCSSLWPFLEVATGRSDIPYDALETLGVQVYGMPAGVPFHSPLLYNQQQLQQILANLEKIVFLKVASQAQQVVVSVRVSGGKTQLVFGLILLPFFGTGIIHIRGLFTIYTFCTDWCQNGQGYHVFGLILLPFFGIGIQYVHINWCQSGWGSHLTSGIACILNYPVGSETGHKHSPYCIRLLGSYVLLVYSLTQV